MKRGRSIAYWAATVFVSCVMAISGGLAISHAAPFMKALAHLGYPRYFSNILGIGKIAGVIVLTRWTKIGSYIVGLWLLAIAANLLTTGMFYDLAVRDVEIAVGAFALSQLSAVREGLLSGAGEKQTAPQPS